MDFIIKKQQLMEMINILNEDVNHKISFENKVKDIFDEITDEKIGEEK